MATSANAPPNPAQAAGDGTNLFAAPDPGLEEDEREFLPSPERLITANRHSGEDSLADQTYFPPTDPVVIGENIVCGFSATSMDVPELAPSDTDGQLGDEALAEAVRLELRTDAATSSLDIDVTVEDRVAYLRGSVPGIEDVESAEEVAARLPGLAEVIEELEVVSV